MPTLDDFDRPLNDRGLEGGAAHRPRAQATRHALRPRAREPRGARPRDARRTAPKAMASSTLAIRFEPRIYRSERSDAARAGSRRCPKCVERAAAGRAQSGAGASWSLDLTRDDANGCAIAVAQQISDRRARSDRLAGRPLGRRRARQRRNRRADLPAGARLALERRRRGGCEARSAGTRRRRRRARPTLRQSRPGLRLGASAAASPDRSAFGAAPLARAAASARRGRYSLPG